MTKHWIGVALLACVAAGCGEAVTAGGKTAAQWAERLKEPDAARRGKAVAKLGELIAHDNAALPAVLGALKDPAPAVRSEAARALGRFGGPAAERALPPLRELQGQDADPKVRDAAAKAVTALSGR